MASLDAQVQELLVAPPAILQRRRYDKLTVGLGLEVRLDAGEGKGKGVFATQQDMAEGQLLFREPPLAAIQHAANRPDAWVCSHCFCFIGSLEQQVARQVMSVREAAAARLEEEEEASYDGGSNSGHSNSADGGIHREAALALEAAQLEALANGTLRLPHTNAIPLPTPVHCVGGCSDEWYCSATCAEAAWRHYHQLLCPGPDEAAGEVDAGSIRGKHPAANSQQEQQEPVGRRAALQEFLRHADETNDVFRLAAIVVARVLLDAQQMLDEQQQQAGRAASCNSKSINSRSTEPSTEFCWQALLAAWQPFAVGCKGLWWQCTSAPPEAAADMRQLAADSLELLTEALPLCLLRHFGPLLALPVWGSIIGMFELNNLSVFVGNPLHRWIQHLDSLPPGEQAEAYAAAGPFIDGLPEELPGCEGNAFYALHSCCNHSCTPNAKAFKRDQDLDGSAVILAMRDIRAGEEVTLAYIDEEASLDERREQLADYGFVCNCDKCAAEELAEALQLK